MRPCRPVMVIQKISVVSISIKQYRIVLFIYTLFHKHKELLYNYLQRLPYSVATGSPRNDPKRQWRLGGGVNVPLKVKIVTEKKEAEDLAQIIHSRGFFCEITAAE